MDKKSLKNSIAGFKDKKVLVLGDIILDRYTFGDVDRVSPEAPILILKKTLEKFTLGGAGNVAANIAALGAHVILCGAVGDDHNKTIFLSLLKEKGIHNAILIEDSQRPTIVKHRFVSGGYHQLLRVDEENTDNLDMAIENELAEKTIAALDDVDVVILSDYAKGVFSKNLAWKIISAAKAKNKKTLADFKPKNKDLFIGVDLISPNLKEAREMSAQEQVASAGRALIDYFKSDALITRGGDGISFFSHESGNHSHVPGRKIKVSDVSGAGDTTIAVMALAVASGLDLESAAHIANAAGSVVVQKPGTATLTLEELISALEFEEEAVD